MKYIGLLSSAASGKLGGLVASHNRGGTYLRHHAIPVQPRTPLQTQVRNQLAAFSSAYKSLTAANVAAWNAAALTVTLKSKLGTTYNPTGQQLFVSCNKNRAALNITTLLTAPIAKPSIPGLTSFTAVTQTTAGIISGFTLATTGPSLTGFGALLRATAQNSASRVFTGKSQFRTIAGYNPASGLPTSLTTLYTNQFGPLLGAGSVTFELKVIDPTSGYAGAPIRALVSWIAQVAGTLFTIVPATTNPTGLHSATTITDVLTITFEGGFTGNCQLSCIGLPTTVAATFTTNPAVATGSNTMTLTLTAAVAGTYPFTLYGSYGEFVVAIPMTLTLT
jgi:hypothetical protein